MTQKKDKNALSGMEDIIKSVNKSLMETNNRRLAVKSRKKAKTDLAG